jgi:hypothetical protein
LLKEEWPEEKRIPIGWCRNNAQRKLVILAGLKRKMARREEGFLLAGAK